MSFRSSGLRVFATLALLFSALQPSLVHAACTSNAIVCENQNPGSAQPNWDLAGSGDPSIQGFATDISYNKGDTAAFKINTPASAYTIDIYRMGYYQGNGARKITSVNPSVALPQTQPACLSDASTGLVDCGNWAASASWAIPTTAASGIYFALLRRTDTGGVSHIVFVIRDDSSTSPLLLQTDDTTWQAYNQWGGTSLYKGSGPGGGSQSGRAYKVSYNRPVATRGQEPGYGPSNFVFYGEYPTVRWLESNGYDVSYTSGLDSDRRGALIKNHKTFLSVAHDEYWSGNQRANVEAARDAGVNLMFLSGNESYWKTRYEPSIDSSHTANRTLVTYKESLANGPIDPQDPTTWTGLWRDPRFSPPADGGRPENGMTGTIFTVNRGSAAIQVPSTYSQMRLWRNTAVASLGTGQTATLGIQTLGYEWDSDLDNGVVPFVGPSARPAGLVDLSSTTVTGTDYLVDYGSTTAPATATHHLTLYKAPSGALVFGAGTVQWVWGLDTHHDTDSDFGPTAPSVTMEQATVNVLADMGVQPTTLQPGLVAATASTDTTPATSVISSPSNGSSVAVNTNVTISGTASDAGGGVVGGVEVSIDGGSSWHPATGLANWTFAWKPTSGGSWALMSRAVDDSGNLQSSPTQINVTVTGDTTPPTVTNVASGLSNSTTAVITWTTDEPATSQVQYGPTTAYGSSTTLDSTLVTSHRQTLSGLALATAYNFRVLSKDQVGNLTTGGNFTFSTPVPASLVRLGDQNVENQQDVNGAGFAEAFPYTATSSGRVTNLFAYIDTATSVVLGLYADSGNPGTLLGQATLANPTRGAWNSVAISPVNVTAGTVYWLALMSPNGTGNIGFRDVLGGGRSVSSSATGLAVLPTTWANGGTWTSTPASLFAADLGVAVDSQAPTVSLSAPLGGATVSGKTVSVDATANDNVGVTSVQFLLDGGTLGAPDTMPPYSVTWDSTTATNGSHTLGARAFDAAGNVGTATGVSVTVSNPPTISGVTTSNLTPVGVTIGWTTNVSSTSQVAYGLTNTYGSTTTLNGAMVTNHSQALTGLQPATLYHYQVLSTDASNNQASSTDLTFNTPAFTVTATQATSLTTTGATLTWTTNAPADSQVDYGTTSAYGLSTTLNPALVTSHSVALTGLTASTLYHYRVRSRDAGGDLAQSADLTFTTAGLTAVNLVGDTKTEATVDSNPAGLAEAFQYTATTSGSANKLFVYVDTGSAATSVVVGLYSDSAGNPGTLLSQGTIVAPTKAAWNSVVIPSTSVTAGSKYWIAVLGPVGAGVFKLRDVASGGNTQNSLESNLTTLPTTWSSGASWSNSPASAYAALAP